MSDIDFSKLDATDVLPLDDAANPYSQGFGTIETRYGQNYVCVSLAEATRIRAEWVASDLFEIQYRDVFGSEHTIKRGEIVRVTLTSRETMERICRYDLWRKSIAAPSWKSED